jgi:glucose/mannose-6-phosphate isomerase
MKIFSTSYLKRFDPNEVMATVLLIPDQARQAWQESSRIKLPRAYALARHIVVCGMGGSLLGPHIIKEMFADRLDVPLTLVNGYDLPASVDRQTLVVLSSYSGTTEEVLSCEQQSRRLTKLRLGISLGGELLKRLKRQNVPYYQIHETYNPSGQPRMGVAYSIFGLLGLLKSHLGVRPAEVYEAIRHTEKVRNIWTDRTDSVATLRRLSVLFRDRVPEIIGSEFLAGNAHVFANQWNENAKTFAGYHVIPEMDHHLLEGLTHPRAVVKRTAFVFLDSPLLHERNRKRIKITKKIIEKQGAKTEHMLLSGPTKLAASLEALFIGSLITTVYSLYEHIDPVQIPWVNFLKKSLAK